MNKQTNKDIDNKSLYEELVRKSADTFSGICAYTAYQEDYYKWIESQKADGKELTSLDRKAFKDHILSNPKMLDDYRSKGFEIANSAISELLYSRIDDLYYQFQKSSEKRIKNKYTYLLLISLILLVVDIIIFLIIFLK